MRFTFRPLYPSSLRVGNLDGHGENYSIASWGVEPRTAGAATVQELVRATPRLATPVRLHTKCSARTGSQLPRHCSHRGDKKSVRNFGREQSLGRPEKQIE